MLCEYCTSCVYVRRDKIEQHILAIHATHAYKRYSDQLLVQLQKAFDRACDRLFNYCEQILHKTPCFEYKLQGNLLMYHLKVSTALPAPSEAEARTVPTVPPDQTISQATLMPNNRTSNTSHEVLLSRSPAEKPRPVSSFQRRFEQWRLKNKLKKIEEENMGDAQEILKVIKDEGETYDSIRYLGQGAFGKCIQVKKQSTNEEFACKILSKR